MSEYLLETHCHTAPVSPCANITPAELARLYHAAGYDGIIVTNHLVKQLPILIGERSWQGKMDKYFSGFRAVREEGMKFGLDVFPGAEITLKWLPKNDLLILGLTEDFFRNIPKIYSLSYEHLVSAVREAGGLLVQAHPFRSFCSPLSEALVDGIEVYNGNPWHESRNEKALSYAEKRGMLQTSGSDAHKTGEVGSGGVYLSARPRDEKHLVELLKESPSLRRSGTRETVAG